MCACENRYPRGKVTRAQREGGRRVTLSPWPYLLHPSLPVGRRGKRNTLLFEKGRRHRPWWCCLSLMERGECHRLYAVALAGSYELRITLNNKINCTEKKNQKMYPKGGFTGKLCCVEKLTQHSFEGVLYALLHSASKSPSFVLFLRRKRDSD